jgi:protein involved in polysaccharide export with SLBB domain
VLTTPTESTQSASDSPTSPDATKAPGEAARQAGEKTYVDTNTPGVKASATFPPTQTQTPASSRIVGPLTQKSDFERFAEDATGVKMPVYGRRLFDEVPTTFAPVERIPVPADYAIGPGDELLIRAWGKIDLDSRVTVDRNGQIYLPKVGTLNVAGLRYEQVEGYLHSTIGSLFKDFDLNVTLGQLRSIQIFVLGNARQPGAYTVSSLSTLVNALFASGGPSATGSMRRIQLRRGGQAMTEFDIYDLAQKGDKSRDVQLLQGDVIYIPPIGSQVAISGNVNEPGIYELKGDTNVAVALDGAGGLTSLAGAARVLLERIDNRSSRRVEEFALDESGLKRKLADGDLLRIYPLSPKFENAVTLRGNVAQPGRYVWKQGMRVSDLIPSRDFLVTRDYWNRQNNVVPRDPDHPFASPSTDWLGNPPADQSERSITDRSGRSGAETDERSNADQSGDSLTDPLGQSRSGMIDAVGRSSSELNWEYAVIERLDERDLSTRLIPFRLADAIDNPASPDNQPLKAGDIVTIFSRADIELPMDKRASFVRVGGEVNAPGVYRANPGETLRDIVRQAGGLTTHSYLYASRFTRVSTRRVQEEQLRQSTEQMQRELLSKYANATPETGQTGADQQAELAMQQAALARLSSIKPIGRVVLEMRPEAATTADIPEFPLEDGDTFYIPQRLSTVQVAGAVYNANAFRHEPNKRLVAYLDDAGGATRDADRNRIFVVRADGTVVSRQAHHAYSHGSFEKMKLLPGDAIVVPEKFRVSNKLNGILQVTQFMSQTALTAAALSVIH